MCLETEPAIRYAQCGFVDMGAVQRVMLLQIRCGFVALPKRRRVALMKNSAKPLEICDKMGPVEKRQPRDVATFTARWCQNKKVVKTIGGSNVLTGRNVN